MFSLKDVRENHDKIRKNLKRRGQDYKIKKLDELLLMDNDYLEFLKKNQDMRTLRNKLTLEINKLKKDGKNIKSKLKEVREIPEEISQTDEKIKLMKEKIDRILSTIPNFIDSSVGTKNKVILKYGNLIKKKVLSHAEISEKLGTVDFDASAKVSGSGFYYLKGDMARLNQALIQFAIDFLCKKKYTYVEPPLMIRKKIYDSVIDMEFFKEQVYKIEGENLYLIGTSEHPLIAMYSGVSLREKDLPLKLCGHSMCFRKEIGSHGVDEKGLYRTHQFNKVEQVIICDPNDSGKYYDELLSNSVQIMKKLKLPFRVVEFGAKETGDWKSKSADVEVWSPRKNDYFEVMSCSNLTDFQSKKLSIKVQGHGKLYHPHTLNNTALATSRILVAILENNQTSKGTIKIPAVLNKYIEIKEIKADH